MAKLSAHGARELARISKGNVEIAYLSTGKVLAKTRGGRWTQTLTYSALRGDQRIAWIASRVSFKLNNGWDLEHESHQLSDIRDRSDYAKLCDKASNALLAADDRAEKARILAAAKAEAERPQREREQDEREQFAEVAIEVREAVSRAICCPSCGGVLDQSTSVACRFLPEKRYFVFHGTCYDQRVASGVTFHEVADGRTVPAHVWRCSNESLVGCAMLASRQTAQEAR